MDLCENFIRAWNPGFQWYLWWCVHSACVFIFHPHRISETQYIFGLNQNQWEFPTIILSVACTRVPHSPVHVSIHQHSRTRQSHTASGESGFLFWYIHLLHPQSHSRTYRSCEVPAVSLRQQGRTAHTDLLRAGHQEHSRDMAAGMNPVSSTAPLLCVSG